MKDIGEVQFVVKTCPKEKKIRGRSFNDREPIWC